MSKRVTRKRVAPKDGRKLAGGWRTDYVDGCEAADREAHGDSSLVPITGKIAGYVIPLDPPDLTPVNPYTVRDEEGVLHLIQSRVDTARRNNLEVSGYFAQRDKVTLEKLREIQREAYGREHRVKAEPMCRSHSFYAGLNKRRKELGSSELNSNQRKVMIEALEREIGKELVQDCIARGGSLDKLLFIYGAKA